MKLDYSVIPTPLPVPLGDLLGHIGLAGTGRSLENDLFLLLQSLDDLV